MCCEFIIMINSDAFKLRIYSYSKFKGGAHVDLFSTGNKVKNYNIDLMFAPTFDINYSAVDVAIYTLDCSIF